MGFKQKIAQMKAEKSLKDRVLDLLDQFTDAEEAEVRDILVDVLDIKADDKPVKKLVFAKGIEKDKKDSADAVPVKTGKRGRRPGSKNKVKGEVVEAAPEVKVAEKAKGRGRAGKFPKIHEDETRQAVLNILKDDEAGLSPKEISSLLFKTGYEAHAENPSFQSRLAAILNGLVKANKLTKVGRGVYKLA